MSRLRLLAGALLFYGRFLPSFTVMGFHARRVFWPGFRPDFHGQRWLVTGASTGIGRHIALTAARAGAEVLAVARPSAALDSLVAEGRAAGLALQAAPCDLSRMADVHRWLHDLGPNDPPFDVLINNAGVMLEVHQLTDEGHETSFATNLLSHYRLTEGLIASGRLAAAAAVINMTSGGAYHVPLLVPMLDVRDPARYNGTYAYAFHKRAQVVLSEYWCRQWVATGRRSYVMHPGWVDTPGVKRSLPRFRAMLRWILRDEAAGADTALWLAAVRPDPPPGEHLWFDRRPRPAHLSPRTRSSEQDALALLRLLEPAPG